MSPTPNRRWFRWALWIAFAICLYLGFGAYAGYVQRHAIRRSVVKKAVEENRLTTEEAADILGYRLTP